MKGLQRHQSITHDFASQQRLLGSPYFLKTAQKSWSSPHRRPHRHSKLALSALFSSNKGPQNDDTTPRSSLLPAGKRQARVQLPALFITISAADTAANLDTISAAVAGGASAVILVETPETGAAQLYEATIAVKEVLRGRAMLLISDRTDVANAAGADGVMLTPSGLPTVVAKGMIQNTSSLVGRVVQNEAEAVQAAAEGANFIILATTDIESVRAASTKQISGSSVPLITMLNSRDDSVVLKEIVAAGSNGVAVPLIKLNTLLGGEVPTQDAAKALLSVFSGSSSAAPSPPEASMATSSSDSEDGQLPQIAQLSQILSANREEVVNAEKQVLGRLLSFLQSACPALEEVSLLKDAINQLDELFLLVVVGEFNSGKSAVINGLLGCRVLAEGILPTTNEISVLKWAESPEDEKSEQTTDGLFVRYINSDLLREINVVDTPGTNVILDRQQRLTEEFVPRSDLVLFVMSADRPFTDSEVQFLRYIRQWGKKVVFVVNKVDLLSSEEEVKEVTKFVADNAVRLLGVEGAKVVPVAARLATEAKLASRVASQDSNNDTLTIQEQKRLAKDPRWHASRFEGLESFMKDFLLGSVSGEGAGESVRLKLRTPLFVAEALLDAAQQALEAEADVAKTDAASVGLVRSQIANFRREMEKEGKIQRDEVARRLDGVSKSASSVVDQTLTLSNWNALSSYILGNKNNQRLPPVAALFRQEVPKDSTASLAALVREHSSWVTSNCQRQVSNYKSFADKRLATLGKSFEELEDVEADELRRDPEARRRWRQLREMVAQQQAATSSGAPLSAAAAAEIGSLTDAAALAAVNAFDPSKTEALLETDVRDAVLSTASTAAGAGAFGVLLTTLLPTTAEDLMAMALSAAVAYASVLSLPLKRAEAKKKAEAATEAAALEVQKKMEQELQTALDRCEAEIMLFIEPLEEMTVDAAKNAEAAVGEIKALGGEVADLQLRVANVE